MNYIDIDNILCRAVKAGVITKSQVDGLLEIAQQYARELNPSDEEYDTLYELAMEINDEVP